MFPKPIKGYVASCIPATGTAAPGEATYGIDWTREDGSVVRGTTGWKTAWPYVWPSVAKVEPSRMLGQAVHGMLAADNTLVWLFVEPIAGTLCGESMSAAAARLRAGGGGGGGALPGGRPTPDGPPGSSDGSGGGGTA